MAVVTMKELLEAGVHFGHQSKRWNPKMQKFIYSARNGIHVIDLHKSIPLIEKTFSFIKGLVATGTILFIGTKKQAQEVIEEEAKRCGMFFVNQRWMGGTLTNFKTLKKNIARLNEIEKMKEDGTFEKLPKKEVILLEREHRKLIRGLGGIRQMTSLPAAVFVVDTVKEQTAIKEAKRLNIPVIAVVDTNSDPDDVDYPVPGNDDAIRSIKLLTKLIADAVMAGRETTTTTEGLEGEAATDSIAVPLEVEEEAMLSQEVQLEDKVLANIILPKEEEEEKRIGF
ncbi:MAG: 30S ribosomal protein S2 [Candidatus Margulisiibacteriota bacterium]